MKLIAMVFITLANGWPWFVGLAVLSVLFRLIANHIHII